jgi:hypothetical protein
VRYSVAPQDLCFANFYFHKRPVNLFAAAKIRINGIQAQINIKTKKKALYANT